MAFLIAIFFGFLVVENVNNKSVDIQTEEKAQVETEVNKAAEKKLVISTGKTKPKKLEPIKEAVKLEPKETVLITEEVKPTPKVEERFGTGRVCTSPSEELGLSTSPLGVDRDNFGVGVRTCVWLRRCSK